MAMTEEDKEDAVDTTLRDLNRELQQIRQFLQEGGRFSEEERKLLKATLHMLLVELDLHFDGGGDGRKLH